MKKRFLIRASLILPIVFLIVILLFPLRVVVHEYSHLIVCKLLGGDGQVYLEGIMWFWSSMYMKPIPSCHPELVPLAGGLSVFLIFGLMALAMRFLTRRELFIWPIMLGCPLLFWALFDLFRAISEWYFWGSNIILLLPDAIMFFCLNCAAALLICELVYSKKIFKWVFQNTKTAK